MFKGENQIWSDIISFLKTSLTTLGYTGWNVVQFQQQTLQELETKTLYVSWIGSRRIGWQKHAQVLQNNEMTQYEGYVEEIRFQVSAYKQRTLNDDVATPTSNDLINRLVTFLQSQAGVKALRAIGYSTPRIVDIRQNPFSTDSDLYEKMPSVDISVFLVQNEIAEIASTDDCNLTMKGI